MEWHLPLAILFHFLDFVVNNNVLVDHVLEVYIVCVEQLELNVIIQSIQKHVLLLFIGVDISGQRIPSSSASWCHEAHSEYGNEP
jgi:hypothetical protein